MNSGVYPISPTVRDIESSRRRKPRRRVLSQRPRIYFLGHWEGLFHRGLGGISALVCSSCSSPHFNEAETLTHAALLLKTFSTFAC